MKSRAYISPLLHRFLSVVGALATTVAFLLYFATNEAVEKTGAMPNNWSFLILVLTAVASTTLAVIGGYMLITGLIRSGDKRLLRLLFRDDDDTSGDKVR
jgi:hypothetical protein